MKTFKQFITESIESAEVFKKEIYDRIENTSIGKIIRGDVQIRHLALRELPDLSNITIYGEFDCRYNDLTSLKGSPNRVYGSFLCMYNHIETLEGAPEFVNGVFNCKENPLYTMKGAPDGIYSFRSDKFTHMQYLEYLENQELKKSIDPETEELFGGMIDEL